MPPITTLFKLLYLDRDPNTQYYTHANNLQILEIDETL